MSAGSTAARWTVAIMVWLFQYGCVVWCVLAWWLMVVSFKVFGLAAFLLLVPVVGWVLLLFVVRRPNDTSGSWASAVWRPWLLDWAKG